MRWMRGNGKIRLDDSDDDDEAVDGLDSIDGGGTVTGKNEYGDMESPVVTANLFERLTFSWLTRKSLACCDGIPLSLSSTISRYSKVPCRGGHVDAPRRR